MHSPGEEIDRPSAARVRRMSAAHVPQAHAILKESPEASIWSTESLLESIGTGFGWVAERDGSAAGLVIGFVIGRLVADQFEILNLAVERASRRRGIATQLVKAMLEDAWGAAARQAFLEVRASNEGAIALYARLGFRVWGRRVKYYRNPVEDALLLVSHNGEKKS